MSTITIFIVAYCLITLSANIRAQDEMVSGTIYVNNNFTFYINGEIVAKDPVVGAPHNA